MSDRDLDGIVGADLSRRKFLGLGAKATGGAVAADVAMKTGIAAAVLKWLFSPREAHAQTGSGRYDVSYIWHPNLDAALDYMNQVEKVLGKTLGKELRVVRGRSGNFGIVYDRDASTREKAEKTARSHTSTLKRADLDEAGVVKDEGYGLVYNISYGRGPNLSALKKAFDIVYKQLGSGLGKRLVIEEKDNGDYALVYKRYGDKELGRVSAARHHDVLKRTDLRKVLGMRRGAELASVIEERNDNAIFGEGSHLDDVIETPKPEKIVKPRKPKPEITTDLEAAIERHVGQLRRRGLISGDERTAWSVYDFDTGEKVISINEDVPMQAASMIKPFIALAYFHEVKHGRKVYGPRSKRNMQRMIQKSSNSATNWFIKTLGGPSKVQEILRRNYSEICKQVRIREYIPSGGRTYRNLASAHDYSRLLYSLWKNQLPSSRELRRVMALPGRDRIYNGVPEIPNGTLVYNKTGTTARCVGDFGILYAKDKRGKRHAYTMVGIVDKPRRTSHYGSWASRRASAIRSVSGEVYKHMKRRHNLV